MSQLGYPASAVAWAILKTKRTSRDDEALGRAGHDEGGGVDVDGPGPCPSAGARPAT